MDQEDRTIQLRAQQVGQEDLLAAGQAAVVDHQPGRLVDHGQVGVLVKQRERRQGRIGSEAHHAIVLGRLAWRESGCPAIKESLQNAAPIRESRHGGDGAFPVEPHRRHGGSHRSPGAANPLPSKVGHECLTEPRKRAMSGQGRPLKGRTSLVLQRRTRNQQKGDAGWHRPCRRQHMTPRRVRPALRSAGPSSRRRPWRCCP